MTLHKEGYPTLIIGLISLTVLNVIIHTFLPVMLPFMAVISVALYLFLVSFFRKPDRAVKNPDSKVLLSPCDGKVVVIEKVFEPEFLKEECLQVSIFMSPLNVHINWYPGTGEVLYYKYHPGKYLAAWNPKASTENERTTVCCAINGKNVLLRQVAGALARRIVCYAQSGAQHQQGDEMGFIKFGSRVDLYLPVDTPLNVALGDKVTGNVTQIASF